MFETTSRYADIENTSLVTKNGEEIAYKKRRFLPDGSKMTLLQEVQVTAGDRLDRISARIIGDPEQYWRICDANNVMHPLELTAESGSSLRIARPWR
ncbi:MAG: hypothetical protein M1503_02865 [Thaumarchaeota archaeon]|nr:hypothetical protein [Nitrososphaerota archaeon]MCL5317193.1 hypothetical protein [Nitrososphaerota archaeon]